MNAPHAIPGSREPARSWRSLLNNLRRTPGCADEKETNDEQAHRPQTTLEPARCAHVFRRFRQSGVSTGWMVQPSRLQVIASSRKRSGASLLADAQSTARPLQAISECDGCSGARSDFSQESTRGGHFVWESALGRNLRLDQSLKRQRGFSSFFADASGSDRQLSLLFRRSGLCPSQPQHRLGVAGHAPIAAR